MAPGQASGVSSATCFAGGTHTEGEVPTHRCRSLGAVRRHAGLVCGSHATANFRYLVRGFAEHCTGTLERRTDHEKVRRF